MSIESLSKVLSGPIHPLGIPKSRDWKTAEGALSRLPEDYKAFIERYGTGSVAGFI